MGLRIDREVFTDEEYGRFRQRLDRSLEALERLLARPGFGVGERTLGAELELSLVDAAGEPLLCNRELLDDLGDPTVTLEIDRFNLEHNALPLPVAGRSLTALGEQLRQCLARLRAAAAARGGRVVTVGILPTLTEEHLRPEVLSDAPRYRALGAGISRMRQEPFRIEIHGEESLSVATSYVTYEGANTSLQLHLRTTPAEFAALHNAAQLATGPALAVAANAPFFLGRRLWDETRIALFPQSVDDRDAWSFECRPRVNFGRGWLRGGAMPLFADSVRNHPVLLPVCGNDEDPVPAVEAGRVPPLRELRLHHGTVWPWNRAVFDPSAGGHLRVELRSLPAGPSVVDMVANAGFLLGLTLALARVMPALVHTFPFQAARANFYAAARSGLAAELTWPEAETLRGIPAARLVEALCPLAERGLVDAGVDPEDAARHLDIIRERARRGTSGAAWQTHRVRWLERVHGLDRRRALTVMLDEYVAHGEADLPVHRWPGCP